MDDLKTSVQNAVYEQKDPLLIYKQESFQMFQAFINEVNKDIISFLMKTAIPSDNVQQAPTVKTQQPKLQTSRTDATTGGNNNPQNQDTRERPKPQPVKVDDKIGRNDPCPCGSGKKYKNCHGSGVAV
jgi:preprotein translocase subunit SecA